MIFEGGGNLGIWKMVGWDPALGPMLKKPTSWAKGGGGRPRTPPPRICTCSNIQTLKACSVIYGHSSISLHY